MDVTGRAAAGQRYRGGAHRGLQRRRARYALAAALLLLLLLPAATEAAPACLPAGDIAGGGDTAGGGTAGGEDGRDLPAVQRATDGLACMPADTTFGQEVHERFAALTPSHAFETRGEIRLDGATTADLYDALHAISTLAGIRYFSVWHRDERVLFNTAHAIDESGAATADPVPSPDGRGLAYALLEDARFGITPFRLEYRTDGDAILLIVSNLRVLSLLVFPLIDPERLLIALLITPAGGGEPRTLYGLVAAQAPVVPFLENLVEDSLRNRLAAMTDWIRTRASVVAGQRNDTGSEARAGSPGAAQR